MIDICSIQNMVQHDSEHSADHKGVSWIVVL